MEPFLWNRYSKKMQEFLRRPLSIGQVSNAADSMLICRAETGAKEEGNWFSIMVVIDTTDGQIADVKYQFFGPTILLVTLEAVSRFIMRKHIKQVQKITPEMIDRSLRDQDTVPAYGEREMPYVLFVLEGVFTALSFAPEMQVLEYETPLEPVSNGETTRYDNWYELSDGERLAILEQVFEEQIRPYLALDEGGVTILGIEKAILVKIAYSGNCTSCYSAIGGTLNGIQSLLREKVHPDLQIQPDLSQLQL